VTTKADLTEEVKKPGRDWANLESKLWKGEVFRRGARLATACRQILSMNGQAYANATRSAHTAVVFSSAVPFSIIVMNPSIAFFLSTQRCRRRRNLVTEIAQQDCATEG
jgi:hypothetical protein